MRDRMEGSEERHARLARNETVFREVNEQIEGLNALGDDLPTFGIVCECGSHDCAAVLTVTKAEYEAVRAQSDRFLVQRGHQIAEIEDVVERRAAFDVVDKKAGVPQRVAEATDPRRSPI